MEKQKIKELALANGFKLKQQPNGTEDLNPYVYEFSVALAAMTVSAFAKYINDTGELNFGDSNFLMEQAHEYVEQLKQGGE